MNFSVGLTNESLYSFLEHLILQLPSQNSSNFSYSNLQLPNHLNFLLNYVVNLIMIFLDILWNSNNIIFCCNRYFWYAVFSPYAYALIRSICYYSFPFILDILLKLFKTIGYFCFDFAYLCYNIFITLKKCFFELVKNAISKFYYTIQLSMNYGKAFGSTTSATLKRYQEAFEEIKEEKKKQIINISNVKSNVEKEKVKTQCNESSKRLVQNNIKSESWLFF